MEKEITLDDDFITKYTGDSHRRIWGVKPPNALPPALVHCTFCEEPLSWTADEGECLLCHEGPMCKNCLEDHAYECPKVAQPDIVGGG